MFLLQKYKMNNDHLEYKWYDKENQHHLMDRIRWRICYEDEERDRVPNVSDLMTHIEIAMDDDTSLYVVPADEVDNSPYDYWYFIY